MGGGVDAFDFEAGPRSAGPFLVHGRACFYSGERYTRVSPDDAMCVCLDPSQKARLTNRHIRRQPMNDPHTVADLARAANEVPATGRNAKFPDARRDVAAVLTRALNSDDFVKKVWSLPGVSGPMGGVSDQVHGIIEIDGDLMPFVVAVYSDQKIDQKVMARLEQAKRDQEVNQTLASLLEP